MGFYRIIFFLFIFIFVVFTRRVFTLSVILGFLGFMVRNLSGKKRLPVRSFISVYIFIGLLLLLIRGFLPYVILLDFTRIFTIIRYLALSFWWMTFLYVTNSERFSLFLCKVGDNVFKCYFLFFIELLSTLIQPFSLMVRLFVNFMVGFFLLLFSRLYLSVFLPFFMIFLGILPLVFELGVFLVQSFIFSYLIVSYFLEFR